MLYFLDTYVNESTFYQLKSFQTFYLLLRFFFTSLLCRALKRCGQSIFALSNATSNTFIASHQTELCELLGALFSRCLVQNSLTCSALKLCFYVLFSHEKMLKLHESYQHSLFTFLWYKLFPIHISLIVLILLICFQQTSSCFTNEKIET